MGIFIHSLNMLKNTYIQSSTHCQKLCIYEDNKQPCCLAIQAKHIRTKSRGLNCKEWAAPFHHLQVLSLAGIPFSHTSFNSKQTLTPPLSSNSPKLSNTNLHSLKHFVKHLLGTWKLTKTKIPKQTQQHKYKQT